MATPSMTQPTGPDPVIVDSEHYTVEFENDKVRVLRIKYGSPSCTAIRRQSACFSRMLSFASGSRTVKRKMAPLKPVR